MTILATANVELLDSRWARYEAFHSPWSKELSPLLDEKSATGESEGLVRGTDGWRLTFEWDALQPQRVRSIQPLLARAEANTHMNFSAKIFADSFPEPLLLSAEAEITVTPKTIAVSDLFSDFEAIVAEAKRSFTRTTYSF